MIEPGQPITLTPTTFRRLPFTRLRRLKGKAGKVRRVVGREPGRSLLECEIDGVIAIVWDFEIKKLRG